VISRRILMFRQLYRNWVPDVSIEITSQIPVGLSLGSSAAVTVATLEAINIECGLLHDKTSIAKMAHEIEKEVQGAAVPLIHLFRLWRRN